jgi:hypothetical protein
MKTAPGIRPEKKEYDEFYAGYVSLVPETDILTALQNQISDVQNLFAQITEEKGDFRYAENKWTIKELLGHIIDAERVFSYRALRISRNDKTPLSGFEENSYVANSNFSQRSLADLLEEFSLLRRANAILFQNLPDEAWSQTGTASDAEVSVRALAYIMVGHVRHHLNILKERYIA